MPFSLCLHCFLKPYFVKCLRSSFQHGTFYRSASVCFCASGLFFNGFCGNRGAHVSCKLHFLSSVFFSRSEYNECDEEHSDNNRFYWFDQVQNLTIGRLCNQQVITAVNGSLPGPTIRVHEGDTLIVHVFNKSPYNLTIHW